MAETPEWAVELRHKLDNHLQFQHITTRFSGCCLDMVLAAFDAQAGKLREERDTASKLYKEAHEMAARETGRLVDQLRQAEERAALWETTAAAHATVIESALKILGESGTDVEAAAERMRERAAKAEADQRELRDEWAKFRQALRAAFDRAGIPSNPCWTERDFECSVDELRERAEADATEIMRLQGELAEERGRVARLEEALRGVQQDIEVCDWRCVGCGLDPEMRETDLAATVKAALAPPAPRQEKA